MAKLKKRLTQHEEFEIMKLVLDKFLLLGFAVMGFGLYTMYVAGFAQGMTVTVVGAVILVIFMAIIIREYEVIK
ncbi:hypothetical protein KY313_01025 [Candidatus Woesearchaeota archaeon]|jgi:hypothetical protein|nr:hypothetical protein [Candidatus Woesearchaeota archaeon]